ncbi:MAG: squalene/phytoene synthase family protein [Terrimesophilobacter sp.]
MTGTLSKKHLVGDALGLYSWSAHHSASRIITDYSTSFGRSSRLLNREYRPGIEDVYALVRIADEIVDGAAEQAGLSLAEQRTVLDGLEEDVLHAISRGYSANLVVHAFAATARATGIGPDLVAPFFASMRRDLSSVDFSQDELDLYIYGSAEVVGVMCLRVFLGSAADDPPQTLVHGARKLGSAFQKINFLRDLSADWRELGRSYFPGIDPAHLTEAQKRELVDDIDADLNDAALVINNLPEGCRTAVRAAHGLFSELSRRVRLTPAAKLAETRVIVPTATKARVLLQARIGSSRLRRHDGDNT